MKKTSAFLALILAACMIAMILPAANVEAAHPTFEKWKKAGEQKRQEEAAAAQAVEPCCTYYYPTFISIPYGRGNLVSFDGGLHYFEVVDGEIMRSSLYNVYPFGYTGYYYNWYYYNWAYYNPYYYNAYYYNPYYYVPYGYYHYGCCPNK